MDKIRVRFDPTDNTLQVFFGAPGKMAYLSPIDDDTPEDVFLIKDEDDRVIGFEGHFYHLEPGTLPVEFETRPLLTPAGRTKQG